MKSNLNQFLHAATEAVVAGSKLELKSKLKSDIELQSVQQLAPDDIDCVEPGESCCECGASEKWWDMKGGEHCMRCGVGLGLLRRSRQLAAQARRLKFFSRKR